MTRRPAAGPARRGLVIIPALVCLVLAGLIGATLVRLAATQRAVVRTEARKVQAEWLAESAVARAAARLAADRRYRGETWEPAPPAPGGEAGAVDVRVEPVEGHPARRRVRAEADFPRGDARRARFSKTVVIELGPETPGGSS